MSKHNWERRKFKSADMIITDHRSYATVKKTLDTCYSTATSSAGKPGLTACCSTTGSANSYPTNLFNPSPIN